MTGLVGGGRLQSLQETGCHVCPASHTPFRASLPCISTGSNPSLLPQGPPSSLVATDHCLLGSASRVLPLHNLKSLLSLGIRELSLRGHRPL